MDSEESSATPPPPGGALHVDFVIAHCAEDLSWLHAVLADLRRQGVRTTVFVYRKCASDAAVDPADSVDAVVDALPNVGREAHTYLHHMATHGDRAARSNVTLYLQGDVHLFHSLTEVQMANVLIFQAMKHGLSTNVRNEFGSVSRGPNNDARYGFKAGFGFLDARWNGTMGEWFDARLAPHLGISFPRKRAVSFYQGACFALHSALQLPAGVLAAGLEDTATGNAPGVAHFFERCWFFVFWAVRRRLVEGGGGPPRWGDDDLDPLGLDRRWRWKGGRRSKDISRRGGFVYWDWEGCTTNWEGIASEDELRYACTDLRAEGGSGWSWDANTTDVV